MVFFFCSAMKESVSMHDSSFSFWYVSVDAKYVCILLKCNSTRNLRSGIFRPVASFASSVGQCCSLHCLWLFVSLTFSTVWNFQMERTFIRLAQKPSVFIILWSVLTHKHTHSDMEITEKQLCLVGESIRSVQPRSVKIQMQEVVFLEHNTKWAPSFFSYLK